jgi:hypothetical protein
VKDGNGRTPDGEDDEEDYEMKGDVEEGLDGCCGGLVGAVDGGGLGESEEGRRPMMPF